MDQSIGRRSIVGCLLIVSKAIKSQLDSNDASEPPIWSLSSIVAFAWYLRFRFGSGFRFELLARFGQALSKMADEQLRSMETLEWSRLMISIIIAPLAWYY